MNKLLGGLAFVIIWGLLAPIGVLAETAGVNKIIELHQIVTVNKDSTIDVEHKTTFLLNGTFHEFYTDYAINNSEARAVCESGASFQCAAPTIFQITGAEDATGRAMDPSEYSVSERVESNGDVYKSFVYSFGESARTFVNETFAITIKYKIFGGIGYDSGLDINYIYMNVTPVYNMEADRIIIDNYFPEEFEFNPGYFRFNQALNGSTVDYEKEYFAEDRMVRVSIDSFYTDRYLSYQIGFPTTVVDQPANLKIATSSPYSVTVEFAGTKLNTFQGDTIYGIPTGRTDFTFSAYGYNDKTITVNVVAGETESIDVELQETFFSALMRYAAYILNCIGLILMPVFILLIYRQWHNKGRDATKVRVVIPYYHPPEDVRPYLMGTIKDETVDVIDITSTLIDTAYRGYIKIQELPGNKLFGIELGGKDYELTKVKDFDTLSENEQLIMNGIFDYTERTTISSLKNKFYTKVPAIKSGIYRELKTKNYFSGRPDEVRRNYFIIGIGILIFGILFSCSNGFTMAIFMYPLFLTLSMAVVVAGVGICAIAYFMPAKTALGSKIYEQLLGFKMYMEVAERFRVQDLTPETFEKYLPYAMIFGIEKKWGERFKDICKTPPSWFTGSTDAWSTIYMINALSAFNATTVSALTSMPQSSGGSSWGSRGGGWSGGGGFSGGFGGGGIGGGSVGGFR